MDTHRFMASFSILCDSPSMGRPLVVQSSLLKDTEDVPSLLLRQCFSQHPYPHVPVHTCMRSCGTHSCKWNCCFKESLHLKFC